MWEALVSARTINLLYTSAETPTSSAPANFN